MTFLLKIVHVTYFLVSYAATFNAWMLVLRSTPNTGQAVKTLLDSSSALNEDRNDLRNVDPNIQGVMKSGFIDEKWGSVFKIRIAMYNATGEVVMWMEFDGSGSSKTSWFTAPRLLSSSFRDDPGQQASNFNISKLGNARSYYVAQHAGCVRDWNWIRIVDIANETRFCDYDNMPTIPRFFYSDIGTQKYATDCEPKASNYYSIELREVKMCKRPGRYLQSSPFAYETGVSLITCGVQCLLTNGCKTYNYHHEDKICELFTICAKPDLHLSSENGFAFWGSGNC